MIQYGFERKRSIVDGSQKTAVGTPSIGDQAIGSVLGLGVLVGVGIGVGMFILQRMFAPKEPAPAQS